MLYLTLRCNVRCDYCFQVREARDMTVETARQAIDFLLDRATSGSARRVTVNFFGGEPFLRPQVMQDTIAYARLPRANCYKRVEFAATTNGTLASPEIERLIKEAQMRLLISLDGGPEAMSARPLASSGRSAYDRVAQNLPRLLAWSPHGVVRLTYRPSTVRELRRNLQHVLELGASAAAAARSRKRAGRVRRARSRTPTRTWRSG